MAKRVNKSMVGALAVLGFILMTVAGVLMVWQLRETDPRRFVELAEAGAKAADWRQAQLYYSRAYQASKDPKWLVEAGQMTYNRGNEAAAVQAWERAVTQDPRNQPALTKLLRYAEEVARRYPTQRQWASVLNRAADLLAVDDQNAFGLYCKGQALRALKEQREENEAEGLAALTRAVEIAPENVDYGLALANWEVEKAAQKAAEAGEDLDPNLGYARYEALVAANSEPGHDGVKIRAAYARVLNNRGQAAGLRTRRAQTLKRDAEEANDKIQAALQAQRIQKLEADSVEWHAKALALLKEGLALAGDQEEDQAEARVRLAEYRYFRDLLPVARDPEKEAEADELTEYLKGLLVEAIDLDPDGFEQYELLASLYQARERYADAIEVCDQRTKRGIGRTGFRRLEHKQGMYQILIQAADMCLREAGRAEGEAERTALLDRAQQYVEDAKGEFPGGPRALHTEGKVLWAQGKDLPALAKFEEADSIFLSSNWENKLLLATLYLQQGQVGAARQAIEAACKVRGADARAWTKAAEIYLETQEYSAAARAATQALRQAPASRRAQLLLAEAYNKAGETELMKRTLELLPDDPKNILVKSRALAREGEYAEALQLLTPILEEDPANVDAIRGALMLYDRLEQPEEAQALIERALAVKPNDITLQTLQLRLESDLSREERQTRRLALVEGIEDTYERALELAQYRLDRGEYEEAETHLREAERLLAERATPKAQEAVERFGEMAVREIVDKRFVVAFQQAVQGGEEVDWSQAEQIAADAAKRNIDGVRGLTFYGRLQLFQGKPKMAVDSFSQALEQRPNDSQTLTFLAQAHLDLRRLEPAREAFEQAVVINPNNGLAHKGLAMLASNRRDAAAFQRHLSACGRFLPDDPWVRSQLLLLRELNDPQAGIVRRLQKREQDPKDADNLLSLGKLYTRVDPPEIDKAQECYDAALEAAKDRFFVAWTVAQFYREHIGPERALEFLKAEVERQTDPDQRAVFQTLVGRYLREVGEFEQADAAYLAAADVDESLEVCMRIGQHFFTTGKMKLALEWLTKAAAKADQAEAPRAPEIHMKRIECLTSLKRLDEAMEAVKELETRFPEEETIARLRANIEVSQGEYAKAITSLTLCLEKHPDDPQSLFQRAGCYTRLAKWNLAIVDLERLKAKHPAVYELRPRKMLASAYDMTNRFDLASSELEALADTFPDNISVVESLIALYRDRERFQDAQRMATRQINRLPNDPRWYAVRAEVAAQALRQKPIQEGTDPARTKEAARVVEDLDRAVRLSEFHPAFVTQLLGAYSEFGPRDEGLRYFEQTLPSDKRTPPAIRTYATLLAQKGLVDEAVQQYRTAVFLDPGQVLEIAQSIAEQAAETLGRERALELFRTPPKDERFRRSNQLIVAIVLQDAGQYSEAITILEELLRTAELESEKAQLSLALGISAGRAGRDDEARRYYEEVLKLEPENWAALNNLAYLLSDVLDEHEVALPYAQKAAKLNPNPTVLDTLGTVLAKLGRYREAIAELAQAARNDPKFVPSYYHLAEAYRCLGEFADAEHLLDEATKLLKEARKVNRAGLAEEYEEYAEPISQAMEKIRNRDQSP